MLRLSVGYMLLASQLLQVSSALVSAWPWAVLVQWEKLLGGLAVSGVVIGYCDAHLYTQMTVGVLKWQQSVCLCISLTGRTVTPCSCCCGAAGTLACEYGTQVFDIYTIYSTLALTVL